MVERLGDTACNEPRSIPLLKSFFSTSKKPFILHKIKEIIMNYVPLLAEVGRKHGIGGEEGRGGREGRGEEGRKMATPELP